MTGKNEQVRHFWNWVEGDSERTLQLNGTIAPEPCYEDDVTPAVFKNELNSGSGPITVWINRPGGDCVCASQIYSMLMDYPHDVTVKIDGIAASAASVIAMAGTKVLMAPTALMMCHNPSTLAMGERKDMQKAMEMLDSVKESIINAYEIKTGLDRKELSRMMDQETWMDATKAVELGFADGILQRDNAPTASSVPVLFSQRLVDMALINKLTAQPDTRTEQSKGREMQPDTLSTHDRLTTPAPDTPMDPAVPIQPFYDRLNNLR